MPVFVNENAPNGKNKWGSIRGYRIQPTTVMHNLIPDEEGGWGAGLGALPLLRGARGGGRVVVGVVVAAVLEAR